MMKKRSSKSRTLPKAATATSGSSLAEKRASGSNVPTVEPNPRRAYTVVLNDQTADQKAFTGTITYSQLMGALRSQIKTHITPALGAAAPATVWDEPWRYLQIRWVKAWGNPYVDLDPASGVKFSVALFAGANGARAPPPDKFDFAAGGSDRPFGFERGTVNHWANGSTGGNAAISLQDADLVHVGVLVW